MTDQWNKKNGTLIISCSSNPKKKKKNHVKLTMVNVVQKFHSFNVLFFKLYRTQKLHKWNTNIPGWKAYGSKSNIFNIDVLIFLKVSITWFWFLRKLIRDDIALQPGVKCKGIYIYTPPWIVQAYYSRVHTSPQEAETGFLWPHPVSLTRGAQEHFSNTEEPIIDWSMYFPKQQSSVSTFHIIRADISLHNSQLATNQSDCEANHSTQRQYCLMTVK